MARFFYHERGNESEQKVKVIAGYSYGTQPRLRMKIAEATQNLILSRT